MRNNILLLIGVVLLYLIPALALDLAYGPSYSIWSGEDSWIPDNQGGWVKHGNPSGEMPAVPSENVPLGLTYIPIFSPAILLILFLFTPLRRYIDKKPKRKEDGEEQGTMES